MPFALAGIGNPRTFTNLYGLIRRVDQVGEVGVPAGVPLFWIDKRFWRIDKKGASLQFLTIRGRDPWHDGPSAAGGIRNKIPVSGKRGRQKFPYEGIAWCNRGKLSW